MAEQIANFRFQNFLVTETHITIEPTDKENNSLSINIEQNAYENEEEHKMKLELNVIVKDEENTVNINVKVVGLFEYDENVTGEAKDVFFKLNAPAILFPHVRAYVTALTAMSGMAPIILPTINLASSRQ